MAAVQPSVVPDGLPLLWLDRVFTGLAWAIPAGALAPGVPAAPIRPRELRPLLRRDTRDYALRDAVWGGLASLAQQGDGAHYRLAALGLAVPGLRGFRQRIRVSDVQDLPDVHSDILCGFLTRLDQIGTAEQNIAGRLIHSAIGYAAYRQMIRTRRPRPTYAGAHEDHDSARPVSYQTGAAELALHEAAAHLAAADIVIAASDLELIARTRLEPQTVADVAACLGMSTGAAYKRRERAERHIAAYLRKAARDSPASEPPG